MIIQGTNKRQQYSQQASLRRFWQCCGVECHRGPEHECAPRSRSRPIYHLTLQIPKMEPVKLVISGPSGVGKDAIVKALQIARPDLHFVVTATSRSASCSTSSLRPAGFWPP